MTYKTHIIAEAGNNHNGDVETAFRLVDIAKDSGADSVKFQIIYPEGLYIPEIIKNGGREVNPILSIRRKSMLSNDNYRVIKEYCDNVGIIFSASIFDERGISLLCDLNVPYIKIASTDLNNFRLLRQVAETKKQLIISTGMSKLSEIERAIDAIYKTGNENIVLLHCVSVYPASANMTNLGFIDTLKTKFGVKVGFSDHTESSISAAVAVSKNISHIEKHFTIDRTQNGFDHAYAMEPDQFKQYICDLRDIERSCQYKENKVSIEEKSVADRARRGIYFSRNIKSGEVIKSEDLLIVRPPSAFQADQIDKVVGKKMNIDREKYSSVQSDDIA